jgi:hypothetical protein
MPKGRTRKGDADVRMNLRVSRDLYDSLQRLTELANTKENTNLSELIRKALESFVHKNKKLL